MNLLDLIFPVSCLQCGKSGKYFCDSCVANVEVLNRFDPFTQTFSIFAYNGIIRKGIIKIKYNFAYDIAKEFSEICVKNFTRRSLGYSNPFGKDTILIPIPLHKSRENWRGFNQSEILGKLIAEKLNWHFENNLLLRISQGKTQVGLKGGQRVRNIRGKFAVNPEAKIYQNRTYIIFDDVLTTGSTINEGIKVLKKSGAQKVFGLTIAK